MNIPLALKVAMLQTAYYFLAAGSIFLESIFIYYREGIGKQRLSENDG